MSSPTPPGPAPAPGAKQRAIRSEQAHLDRVHDRVEALRRRAADRMREAGRDRSGATFQARFERDVAAHHHAARAARLTFGDVESLAFGRLDLADGEVLHVGRLSVVDEHGDLLLVDWRAPAAAPFYQATPAEPLAVARRRTLLTRGRRLEDLDDEIIDVDAADALGLQAVTGQGALLASLSRERSTTMRDIVATIQAEQDRIIRAPATGTLVVTGGPGTGKTVVALHRVAFLLYRDRARFEGRGVLVIGPTEAFTRYTARVLPALGEDKTVQRPLAGLAPRGVRIEGWDTAPVARIKGRLGMAEVCRGLVERALPPIPPETRVSHAGTTVVVPAAEIERIRARQVAKVRAEPGRAYHDRSGAAEEALRALLYRRWADAHVAAGASVEPTSDRPALEAALEVSPQITMLGRCYWPVLRAEAVLEACATGQIPLGDVAGDVLTSEEIRALADAWSAADHWTTDDVALLDEVATVLGSHPERTAASRRDGEPDDGGLVLASDRLRDEVVPVDVEADDYADFAHVVVDEAQDLTPMQWRMVARRGPYASWTVVGDRAQRSHTGTDTSWEDVAALIGRRDVAIVELEVNYRTPAEVAEVARAVLTAGGGDPAGLPRAVRSTGERPLLIESDRPADAVVARLEALLEARDGTIAVIVDERTDVRSAVTAALAGRDAATAARVVVTDVHEARGLEFDDVVVVSPERILAEAGAGAQRLYVAVTRATRSLAFVTVPGARVPGREHCEVMVRADTPGCR